MQEQDATVGGARRHIALILGKSGLYASVNGGEPSRLSLPGDEKKKPLTVDSLLEALDTFTLADAVTHVTLIGTRADGSAGWDQIDPRELQNYGPKTLRFNFLTEAHALQHGHTNAKEGDFLIRSTNPVQFSNDAGFLVPDKGTTQVCAYLIFATARRSDNVLEGSVRWWVEQDGEPTLVDIIHNDNRGKIYTIPGGSIVTTTNMVVSEVDALLKIHPEVTVVYVWSQDGVAQYQAYTRHDGDFWYFLRPKGSFEAANGKVAVALSAMAIARLVSAGNTPTPPSTAGPTEADGDTTEGKDGA